MNQPALRGDFHDIFNFLSHHVCGTMRNLSLLILTLSCFLCISSSRAQSTIFITRHADRYGTEPDPELTPAGLEQAQRLAILLSDANIRHIFTTELIRSRETAEPLAHQAGIAPVIVQQDRLDELIAKVHAAVHPNESILIVGHRATVPKIVRALAGIEIPPLQSNEYGRLIAITLFPDGHASTVTLRYSSRPSTTAVGNEKEPGNSQGSHH